MYIAGGEIHKIQLGASPLFLMAFKIKDIIHLISRVFWTASGDLQWNGVDDCSSIDRFGT